MRRWFICWPSGSSITQQVGDLKARHGLPPADPQREAQQITRLRALAAEAKLDPEFAEKFLTFVVAEVVRHHEAALQDSSTTRSETGSPLRSGSAAGDQGRSSPTGRAAAEKAAAEEGSLQSAVAVHSAAPEAGRLAHRVHARQRRPVRT